MESDETTVVTQSLLNLSENSSAARIRTLESNEYCKHAKTNIKVLKTKIQSLSAANSDAVKSRNELLARKKINSINLKSLIQTRNEFYNYKCDVKTHYVNEEVTMKNKRLRYNGFTKDYIDKWEAFEDECKKIGTASEILVLQAENKSLDAQLIRLRDLWNKTEREYFRKMNHLQRTLNNKIVEFIEEYLIYSDFLTVNKNIRNFGIQINNLLKDQHLQKSLSQEFRLQRNILKKKNTLQPIIRKDLIHQSLADSFSAHLKALDNIILPLESLPLEVLEIPNEEYSFTHGKNTFANLDNTKKSGLEIGATCKKPCSPKSDSKKENLSEHKNKSNTEKTETCENKDSVLTETEGSAEARRFSANDNGISTASDFRNVQCTVASVPLAVPPEQVSRYWEQTRNGDMVLIRSTESTEEKPSENQSFNERENMLDRWGEAIGKNLKKQTYSTSNIDAALSMQSPVQSQTQKPISKNFPEGVQDNHAEERQSQNAESDSTRLKLLNKESTSLTGVWTQNQAHDESNDQSKERNVFSFFSSDSSSDGKKPGSGSSIFTLF